MVEKKMKWNERECEDLNVIDAMTFKEKGEITSRTAVYSSDVGITLQVSWLTFKQQEKNNPNKQTPHTRYLSTTCIPSSIPEPQNSLRNVPINTINYTVFIIISKHFKNWKEEF